ncbi:MAG TPA: hypothetical protein VFQ53_31425 [Kofleriaceae bacterium]|nr:hypothetical protein [Kofleriaceae bacterium]
MRRALLLIATCCACRTVVPSHPFVSGGGQAVTLGEPIGVLTSWEGECEPSMLELMYAAPTPGGRKTVPCNFVDYDVSVACGDACTWQLDHEMTSILITPTKLGTLRATVTLVPKNSLRRRRTFPLDPVVVATPTSASAICELAGGKTADVDVALYADRTLLSHHAKVRVVGGDECRPNDWQAQTYAGKRAFTCGITDTHTELEIYDPDHYRVTTTASCALVYPAPESATRVAGPASFRIRDPYNNQCPGLLDATREAFANRGWRIDGTDTTGLTTSEYGHPVGATKLVASRNGVQVTMTITYTEVEDASGCTWMLASSAPGLKGSDEIRR